MNLPPALKGCNIEKTLDTFITRSKFSIPLFFIVLYIIFELTFSIGNFIANIFDISLNYLYQQLSIDNLFIHSIFGWIVWVLVYLPNVFILYFFLFLLQDSWILPRISYVFDKYLQKIGLSGKWFLSMFLWFWCTIPAILSTDSIKNRKERILTVMVLPFISCSAKLPVFILLISAFIPHYLQSISLIGLYVFGILVGLLSNTILTFFLVWEKKKLLAHLPKYSIPNLKDIFNKIWKIIYGFVKKISLFVIPFSIIITLAFSYPNTNDIKNSYWAKFAQSVWTIFKPLWFNNEMSISVFSWLIWKEVIVSTMWSLYYLSDTEDNSRLIEKIQKDSTITIASAMSFLIFVLLYTACMWAVFTARWELWNYWGLIFFVYPILVAWIVSFLVYRLLLLL